MIRLRTALSLMALAIVLLPCVSFSYWIQHINTLANLDPAGNPEQFRPAADGSPPEVGKPPLPVEMELLPLPAGWSTQVAAAVARGVENWDNLPGSSMQVSVSLPGPDEPYDGGWQARQASADGRNTIEFVTDWPSFWGPLVIGTTVPKLDPASGRMLEADVFLNARDYRWMVFAGEGTWPGLVSQNIVDVEALVTHEMGHVLGLGHSQLNWATMYTYGAGVADTRARRLTNDDLDGLRVLYPSSLASIPAPSIQQVALGAFSDGKCGMTYLSAAAISPYYDPYLEKTYPLPPGSTQYCLFGSGFRLNRLAGMDLTFHGNTLGAVANAAYATPNAVQAEIWNNSGGYPEIPAGSYDFAVMQNPGQTGYLEGGYIVNAAGNARPVAALQPAAEFSRPKKWLGLDGAGSTDADGDTITFEWSVVESPPGYAAKLSSVDTPETSVYLPAPGVYVVRLIVNDGIVDSVADQVILRAQYSISSSGGTDGSPFSCTASRGSRNQDSGLSWLLFILPLFLSLFLSIWARRDSIRF